MRAITVAAGATAASDGDDGGTLALATGAGGLLVGVGGSRFLARRRRAAPV